MTTTILWCKRGGSSGKVCRSKGAYIDIRSETYSGPQKLDSAEALNLGWAAGGNQYGDQEESYERI